MVVALGFTACALPVAPAGYSDASRIAQLQRLLPADAVLLGEQHDAPDHQQVHLLVVKTLASQHLMAALLLEMASQGNSTNELQREASEEAVRTALQWNNEGWPWAVYGPAVMAAVRAGVPVKGANLPSARLREAMADAELDTRLAGPALKAQQQSIRIGHCDMLPESQITPMTRVQIARDRAMAQTIAQAARPGQVVVLLAGGGHVDRTLGVPLHLPAGLNAKSVLIQPQPAPDATQSEASFDAFWPALPAPPVDYCAGFSASQRKRAAVPAPQKIP